MTLFDSLENWIRGIFEAFAPGSDVPPDVSSEGQCTQSPQRLQLKFSKVLQFSVEFDDIDSKFV